MSKLLANKKKFVFILTFLLVILSSNTTLAYGPNKLDVVSEKYGLVDIDKEDLPEGIKPIEFNSIEELEAFLDNVKREQALRNESARQEKAYEQESLQPFLNDDISISAYYTATKSKRTAFTGAPGYFNIRVKYTYTISYYNGTPIYRFVSVVVKEVVAFSPPRYYASQQSGSMQLDQSCSNP